MNALVRNVGLVLCWFVAAPLITSCAHSEQQRSAGQTVDDATITAKVKAQLFADPDVSALSVNVTTYKGQVQLSGYVDNPTQRSKAEQIAKTTNGVKSVSNDLIVKAQ
jgi:hyperosmotically inducible protein